MSFLLRQVAHCDVCGHEWIVVAAETPSHCAKCKSRKWNHPKDGPPMKAMSGLMADVREYIAKSERTVEYEE